MLHISTIIQTVAQELRSVYAQEPRSLEEANEELAIAMRTGDWTKASALHAEVRRLTIQNTHSVFKS